MFDDPVNRHAEYTEELLQEWQAVSEQLDVLSRRSIVWIEQTTPEAEEFSKKLGPQLISITAAMRSILQIVVDHKIKNL